MSYIPPPPPSKPQAYVAVDFLNEVIDPALEILMAITGKETMWSYEGQLNLLAIAFQETDMRYRRQHPSGPARGFWQFEGGGNQALGLLMVHDVAGPWLHEYCTLQVLTFEREYLYNAIQWHDQLAAVLARLLLYTDPRPLPVDDQLGWEIYLDCWQPGDPRPEHWPDNWMRATDVLNPPVA